MNIYKIALTGGPCAGKTTILKNLKELLTMEGYYVITIEETATTLIKRGTPPLENHEHKIAFQNIVLQTQLFKEKMTELYCQQTLKTAPELFENQKGIIILCDRGIMDNRAYLTQEEYDNILKNNNLNELELLNSYDIVINLLSLAFLNKDLYQLDGIRYETPEMAATRDSITSAAWLLHPNLHIIKPTNTIEEKTKIVYNLIKNHLNGIQIIDQQEINKDEINIELNEDNSRQCIKTIYDIYYPDNEDNCLVQTKYKDYELYELYLTRPSKRYILSKEEFLILYDCGLLKINDEINITNFIHEGNHYEHIKTKNYEYTQLTNNNILEFEKSKKLTKTRTK